MQDFFKFFGHRFDPIVFLKDQSFSYREKFIFYNMIGQCLTLDPLRSVELHFDLQNLSTTKIFYEQIYLDLDLHYREQMRSKLHFFYPDILNSLAAQIEPVQSSDTRQVMLFEEKQASYEHFGI